MRSVGDIPNFRFIRIGQYLCYDNLQFKFSRTELSSIIYLFCRYAYPPPDGNILTNIVNALIAVPRFYTQVVPHWINLNFYIF